MTPRTRSRIAFGAAATIVVALGVFVACVLGMVNRASNTDPDPNGSAGEISIAVDGTEVVTQGIDWDYWLSVNPDIVGWIRIPGTHIDYPIVHAPASDPDYYLSHDVYGGYNAFGAVYLDSSCDGLFAGGNSVVFAHHVNDSIMFGLLARYSDRAWAQEHRVILLLTPNGKSCALTVQAADVIPGDDAVKRTDFSSDEDLMAYWQERFDASDMRLAESAVDTDQLFTFVTCSYNFRPDDERTLTYAVEDF